MNETPVVSTPAAETVPATSRRWWSWPSAAVARHPLAALWAAVVLLALIVSGSAWDDPVRWRYIISVRSICPGEVSQRRGAGTSAGVPAGVGRKMASPFPGDPRSPTPRNVEEAAGLPRSGQRVRGKDDDVVLNGCCWRPARARWTGSMRTAGRWWIATTRHAARPGGNGWRLHEPVPAAGGQVA